MNVDEHIGIRKDRRWCSVDSAYFHGKERAFMCVFVNILQNSYNYYLILANLKGKS